MVKHSPQILSSEGKATATSLSTCLTQHFMHKTMKPTSIHHDKTKYINTFSLSIPLFGDKNKNILDMYTLRR